MKNLLILTMLAAIILSGCSKEQNVKTPKSFTEVELENLNKYRPPKDVLPEVYHSFRKEVKEMKEAGYKSTIDPVDRPVDEAVWLLEVTTNADFGFVKDSIEELFIDTLVFTLNNKSVLPSGVPVIDGDEIVATFQNIENTILQNDESGYLFWATKISITDINDSQTTFSMINAGGPESEGIQLIITPLGPGAEIEPFAPGYTNYAGIPGTLMVYAERDYWNRIRASEFALDPGYVLEYKYNFYKSAYIDENTTEERLLYDYGECASYLIPTSEFNEYLFSSKEVIDENNPHVSHPELIIAWFRWNCWEFDAYTPWPGGGYASFPWFEHSIEFDVYETIYVGGGYGE